VQNQKLPLDEEEKKYQEQEKSEFSSPIKNTSHNSAKPQGQAFSFKATDPDYP
jgi:hypothetical protein